jgi:group I intron endonuclease
MASIYKITNKINGKVYIGKTELSIFARFKLHISDSKKDRCKNRPLYRAFSKYGIENFTIELLEITNKPEVREIFWIDFYKSYGNKGYNATKGGDGKSYIDPASIIKLHNQNLSPRVISEITGHDRSTILKILQNNNITPVDHQGRYQTVKVYCIDLNITFESIQMASLYIINNFKKYKTSRQTNMTSKISLCCRGLRKTAYGFAWKYV